MAQNRTVVVQIVKTSSDERDIYYFWWGDEHRELPGTGEIVHEITFTQGNETDKAFFKRMRDTVEGWARTQGIDPASLSGFDGFNV